MPKKKVTEEKLPKYFEAQEKVKPVLDRVLTECSDKFGNISSNELVLLFTGEKYKSNKKPVRIKFIRQPYNFINANKKVFLLINFEYWDSCTHSEQIKTIIEALLGLSIDDDGEYQKRDYDVVSYRELLKNPEEDYSKFSKILPLEKPAENLELT